MHAESFFFKSNPRSLQWPCISMKNPSERQKGFIVEGNRRCSAPALFLSSQLPSWRLLSSQNRRMLVPIQNFRVRYLRLVYTTAAGLSFFIHSFFLPPSFFPSIHPSIHPILHTALLRADVNKRYWDVANFHQLFQTKARYCYQKSPSRSPKKPRFLTLSEAITLTVCLLRHFVLIIKFFFNSHWRICLTRMIRSKYVPT